MKPHHPAGSCGCILVAQNLGHTWYFNLTTAYVLDFRSARRHQFCINTSPTAALTGIAAMDSFEAKLAEATKPESRRILGAIGLVVNNKGEKVYHHASGFQSLDDDAQPLDPDSTFALASAGKFITHLAALQLVERGLVALDDPVEKHLPELASLPLISRDAVGEPCKLHPLTVNKITLRHLLLHTSGLSSPDVSLIREYLADDNLAKPSFPDDAPTIVKHFSIPLVFEPGDGFAYGYSIHWTQLLVGRLSGSGSNFLHYIQENIFDPLGMASSTYMPRDRPEIWNRRLQMVEREGKTLLPADDATQGLTCSVSDTGKILADLISPSPKVLKDPALVDLLFTGQLPQGSTPIMDLRSDQENYMFCAGPCMPGGGLPPAVNWTAAGMVVESGTLELTGLPPGTVTWQGMPNVMWAMNRERGVAMVFVTQVIPVGDEEAGVLGAEFMKSAWRAFG
ncbi:beta-lactamase/transpeptidase-like protein [Cercophora newfieldiana]|uniref:Beta-lactamase/transpeptidase-like protein n=1 Tax=Cercophora newfieldiana TaxID=92897 RepID=A0AA39YAZ7_9PEZI|nr:beta-lactamase/transpeptidase-like protein [Cercophora newfieldiana]